MASHLPTLIALGVTIFIAVSAHSVVTEPQSMSPKECRVGGPPGTPFIYNCRGPCNLDRLMKNPPQAYHYPEKIGNTVYPGGGKTAATYARGEKVEIKYSRNNHSPGGFNRFSLVHVDDAMNRAVHDKNSFWYSCWGAKFRVATEEEKKMDKWYYNISGNDGKDHAFPGIPVGYYTVDIVIPKCIPDGKYILGYAWFGGSGEQVKTNTPSRPGMISGLGDYWSCSYVEIKGGAMEDKCDVVFDADSIYSKDQCMAVTDRLGNEKCNATPKDPQGFSEDCQCKVENCRLNGKEVRGSYMKPVSFQKGKNPSPLTPENWGGKSMPTKQEDMKKKGNEVQKKCVNSQQYEHLRTKYNALLEESRRKSKQTVIRRSKKCGNGVFLYCSSRCAV